MTHKDFDNNLNTVAVFCFELYTELRLCTEWYGEYWLSVVINGRDQLKTANISLNSKPNSNVFRIPKKGQMWNPLIKKTDVKESLQATCDVPALLLVFSIIFYHIVLLGPSWSLHLWPSSCLSIYCLCPFSLLSIYLSSWEESLECGDSAIQNSFFLPAESTNEWRHCYITIFFKLGEYTSS
jgi:hypothetical protein